MSLLVLLDDIFPLLVWQLPDGGTRERLRREGPLLSPVVDC